MTLTMALKSMAGKVLGSAAGWFAAGSFMETAVQYGLTEVHRITQGVSGQEDIDGSKVLTAGGFGAVLGGVGTRLAYSERFNRGVDIVGNVMRNLGAIIGLNASKAKLLKAGDALRRAAETALIDTDAVKEFAERVFRPRLEQLTKELQKDLNVSGEMLQAKALEAMRRPAVGCFVAGTLVHTKEGLKPIEQIKVGDWVLSRPEDPANGTEPGYKRVSKTFRFENKEVVKFWWERSGNVDADMENWDSVYVTPNHPVWLNPNGWVAMGRLYMTDKSRPGTIERYSYGEWAGRELVLADGTSAAMLDVFDLYRTDKPEIAFKEGDDWGWGALIDFSEPAPKFVDESIYDEEKWGEDPVPYATTVYNLEVEDWHTYFVGKTGLWVHNTNCFDPVLEVAPGKGDVDRLLADVLQYSSSQAGQSFKKLTRAELNDFLKKNPNTRQGLAVIKMDGANKHMEYGLGDEGLPNGVGFEDGGWGRLVDTIPPLPSRRRGPA